MESFYDLSVDINFGMNLCIEEVLQNYFKPESIEGKCKL